jgi:ammonia channel protein AmtB
MLESGKVRPSNIKSILAQIIMGMCVSGLSFWLLGFGLAYGCEPDHCSDNRFISDKNWYLPIFPKTSQLGASQLLSLSLIIDQFLPAASLKAIVGGLCLKIVLREIFVH